MIIENANENFNRTLLLTNKTRDGLLLVPDSLFNLLVKFDEEGHSFVSEVSDNFCRQIDITLMEVVEKHLDLEDMSADNIGKYMVTPEMEVERIFNTLRFKYLKAIYLSNIENPQTHIKYTYNKAFQTLAGLIVYQGNPIQRKENDAFWKDASFTVEAKNQNWEKERREMRKIIALMKLINAEAVPRLYAELIAIKPGFHELYLHDDYFEKDSIPNGPSPRDTVFRILRNKAEISSLAISRLPPEINNKSYIGYAPCSVTEGPFVFRKSISVSYYDEIRRVKRKKQTYELNEKFHILDYFNEDVSTHEKLGALLEKAKVFRGFIT